MKKTLLLILSLFFVFACKGIQDDGTESSMQPKDIDIEKIVIGTSDVSDKNGKEIKGGDLNENKIIPDFEVQDSNFTIKVYHKTGFTVERIFVTFDGLKQELQKSPPNTVIAKEYQLVQGKKTEIIVEIIGEGYKQLKLTFNVTYKKPPSLTFKSISINGTKYTDVSDIQNSTITFEPTDTDPVTLYAEMVEESVIISFEQLKPDNEYYKIDDSNISVPQGEKLSLRMCAEKTGYTSVIIPFKLARKKGKENIVLEKIEVDGTQVAKGGSIEVTKLEAKVRLEITLKQNYESKSFVINDLSMTPIFDITGTIATFDDFVITKDGNTLVKIKVLAKPDEYIECEETISITHHSPAPIPTEVYINAVAVTAWDSEDGGHVYPDKLRKEEGNWIGSVYDGGPHRFTIEIDTKDKDITDHTKFKIYMKESNSAKVYFDKITGQKKGAKLIVFERFRDTMGNEIHLSTGTTTLDVQLYYEDDVVETCQFIVKR